jgi:hypothetical protein
MVTRLMEAMPSGSWLALSHPVRDIHTQQVTGAASRFYQLSPAEGHAANPSRDPALLRWPGTTGARPDPSPPVASRRGRRRPPAKKRLVSAVLPAGPDPQSMPSRSRSRCPHCRAVSSIRWASTYHRLNSWPTAGTWSSRTAQTIAQREWWHRLQYTTTIAVRVFGDDQPEVAGGSHPVQPSSGAMCCGSDLSGNPRR